MKFHCGPSDPFEKFRCVIPLENDSPVREIGNESVPSGVFSDYDVSLESYFFRIVRFVVFGIFDDAICVDTSLMCEAVRSQERF